MKYERWNIPPLIPHTSSFILNNDYVFTGVPPEAGKREWGARVEGVSLNGLTRGCQWMDGRVSMDGQARVNGWTGACQWIEKLPLIPTNGLRRVHGCTSHTAFWLP